MKWSISCIPTLIQSFLTSSAASSFGSNWQKIWSSSLRITLAKTFSRPLEAKFTKVTSDMEGNIYLSAFMEMKDDRRCIDYRCGIPMITLSMPAALALSMMVLRAGMRTSQPSRPKRFSDDHFLARKSSNLHTQEVSFTGYTHVSVIR